jgi:serine/threonine protein kinase
LHNTALNLVAESDRIDITTTDSTLVGNNTPPSSYDFPFLAPPQHAEEIGWLGPYRVLGVIGRGGMGVVFRAEDPQLKRKIALKAMLPSSATNAADVARFLREARSQAAVEHDHVAAIHQVGEDRGIPFIAMPLLKGQPLSNALRMNPRVPIPEAVRIAREMAEGLAAAHECGLIHRDIKPGNVWLEGKNRRVKILDFGLARVTTNNTLNADSDPTTTPGLVVGTPAYMSPEQAKGDPLDARSDLFSLGIVLYQMLTGREPFRAATVTGLLIAVATDHPQRPGEINALVKPELDAFTMRLLAKNRDDRPSSGEEVARQLRLLEPGLGVTSVIPIPLDAVPMASAATDAVPSLGQNKHTPPDPWEAIDDPETQIDGIPTTSDCSSSRLQRMPESDLPRKRPWLLIGSLLAFVVVTAVAASDIIIKIKNKDGTETEIKAPDGSTVTVQQNGKEIAKVGPEPKKELTKGGDSDRAAARWALSISGRVKVNDQEDWIGNAAGLPSDPLRLTHVEFSGNKQLTDAGLSNLKDCKNLKGLGLHDTSVTDAGLIHFKGCTTLVDIDLSACLQVKGSGLVNFKDCKGLTRLGLGNTSVDDASVAAFGDCKNLTYLDLGHTSVGDAGVAHFKGCKKLAILYLGSTRVTNAGLAAFAGSKNLSYLALDSPAVGDAGLDHFKDCISVECLDLQYTGITNTGLAQLRDRKFLKMLLINGTKVTPVGIAEFAKALPMCTIKTNEGTIEARKSNDP